MNHEKRTSPDFSSSHLTRDCNEQPCISTEQKYQKNSVTTCHYATRMYWLLHTKAEVILFLYEMNQLSYNQKKILAI